MSSLPICMCFLSFSCLIALTKTSNTILNASYENGHNWLVLHFRGNIFSSSLLSVMLLMVIIHSPYYIEDDPSIPNLYRGFSMKN
jgi:hypothetical protein